MPRTKSDEDWLRTKILDVRNKFTIGGTEVTASAAELNLTDKEAQTVSADGAITIKNGVAKVTKAGVAVMTLANPTDVTDDNKELTILSTTAQAHTLTVTGGFGNGSTGEDVATFSGAIGDNINLKAYGGYWYITGAHQVAVA